MSFLFNMLEHSFEIRENTEELIVYSESGEWILWAQSAGNLTQDLIYFEYDTVADSIEEQDR